MTRWQVPDLGRVLVWCLLWLLAVLTVPLSSWDIRSPATAVDTPTFDTPTVVEAAVSA